MNCRGRNIYIDSLRGVSILMIMFLHAFAFVDSHDFGREITIALSRLNLGVPFFFVISGFVISLKPNALEINKAPD